MPPFKSSVVAVMVPDDVPPFCKIRVPYVLDGRAEAVLENVTLPRLVEVITRLEPVPDVVSVPLLVNVPVTVKVLLPISTMEPEFIVTLLKLDEPGFTVWVPEPSKTKFNTSLEAVVVNVPLLVKFPPTFNVWVFAPL